MFIFVTLFARLELIRSTFCQYRKFVDIHVAHRLTHDVSKFSEINLSLVSSTTAGSDSNRTCLVLSLSWVLPRDASLGKLIVN
jgi:hypothetical protein